MREHKLRSFWLSLGLVVALLGFQHEALAGPPLICWPFQIGDAKSLPWGGTGWHDASRDYDLRHLTDDTLALLGPHVPVLVRMETLRRATVYAMRDSGVANDLLARIKSRALATDAKRRPEALALFDLGYLAEAFKQTSHISKRISAAHGMDGYALVVKAIGLRGGDADMEFAAALMTIEHRHPAHQRHFERAVSGAAAGSLLARNLVSHFPNRGKTLAELRASMETTKN